MGKLRVNSRNVLVSVLAIILCFSFQSSAKAATVGQDLISPESGWQRVDDQNVNIAYIGKWGSYTFPTTWKNTMTSSFLPGSKMVITFFGTKFRILDPMNADRSSNIKISIDRGVPETFNEYAPAPKAMALVYEKTGLSPGVHTVEVTFNDKAVAFDAFDIDSSGYLINSNVVAPNGLLAEADKEKINLSWNAVSNAQNYSIKRTNEPGGPYQTIASNVTATTYSDVNVTPGITYYYVVTGSTDVVESVNSNEASATPEFPDNNRGLLTISLTNGTEKEFDLPIAEVNKFIKWYEQKDAGVGSNKYGFSKSWNKGPFAKRTEYVVFDKILTFSVDEYTS
ncbi:fibronectin type III domain-containing protein [Paenibacillus glufosinatiresistens]|uniref:fibronectin type III domain-containing protein n=1 Tax=Paenibacillus glufosinatiresistens TaxID=3070657 RepID=UPI00286D8D5B|nr:fibronectin type III domain-containing protein [Paenibacillus sp. YX.27]